MNFGNCLKSVFLKRQRIDVWKLNFKIPFSSSFNSEYFSFTFPIFRYESGTRNPSVVYQIPDRISKAIIRKSEGDS